MEVLLMTYYFKMVNLVIDKWALKMRYKLNK